MTDFETVLSTPELGPGNVRAVHAHGTDIAVANIGQTYYAVEATCPVDGTNLARNGQLDGDYLVCPGDHARFDMRTGERVDGSGALRPRTVQIMGNDVRIGPPRGNGTG
jgi:nitrite reductase/ring-hydroxylating ferredoxin subunit